MNNIMNAPNPIATPIPIPSPSLSEMRRISNEDSENPMSWADGMLIDGMSSS